MGGNVASMYAGIFPENVSHLVNVEGFGLKESDPNNAPSHYQQWIAKQNDVQAFREYNSLHDLALRIKKKIKISVLKEQCMWLHSGLKG